MQQKDSLADGYLGADHEARDVLPASRGANKKPFPRGAPMQHLLPCRNPERPNGHLVALAQDSYCAFPEKTARVEAALKGKVSDTRGQAAGAQQRKGGEHLLFVTWPASAQWRCGRTCARPLRPPGR